MKSERGVSRSDCSAADPWLKQESPAELPYQKNPVGKLPRPPTPQYIQHPVSHTVPIGQKMRSKLAGITMAIGNTSTLCIDRGIHGKHSHYEVCGHGHERRLAITLLAGEHDGSASVAMSAYPSMIGLDYRQTVLTAFVFLPMLSPIVASGAYLSSVGVAASKYHPSPLSAKSFCSRGEMFLLGGDWKPYPCLSLAALETPPYCKLPGIIRTRDVLFPCHNPLH